MFKLLALSLILFSHGTFAKTSWENIKGFDLVSGISKEVKLEGQFSVVYFFNVNCPCSKAHFDHLNSLKNRFPDFSFIGFHSNKAISQKTAKKYFAKFEIEFPIFLDKELYFANIFKALKTPHVFIVDPQGELVFQGGATNSRNPKKASKFYLLDALTALNQGQQPPTVVAKTLGCYIQR
ncbi:MAG: hypothetical protein DRQ88_08875 [Epsilonproteobacteria bacterium]|nr:MAG: hypothetical protein DRQ89_08850 [Campylobacterota bacterium]RLA65695.1 MAG: hypothetical protein DRQ88_08875 [Campylobacterota bacterium]